MKINPILFSTPMVQAIIQGNKTQTRRTKKLDSINENPNMYGYYGNGNVYDEDPDDKNIHWFYLKDKDGKALEEFKQVKCPYGKVGDVLWVRETWNKFGEDYFYKANFDSGNFRGKPSIHMPKEACRLFLKITDIRVERLQDISEIDAIKEGIYINTKTYPNVMMNYMTKRNIHGGFPSVSFATLWQSINGKDSWNSNPWVWVISFERIEKPENFI